MSSQHSAFQHSAVTFEQTHGDWRGVVEDGEFPVHLIFNFQDRMSLAGTGKRNVVPGASTTR